MARRKHKIVKNLPIDKLVAEGKGLVRQEGKVIFVEGAVPGDVVDVRIYKKKKDFSLAKVINIVSPSPDRVAPFCSHFGSCGGCKWQYLTYSKQLEYKQQIVEESLRRVGKLDFPNMLPILGTDPSIYYRNKMEFTFSNRRWLTKAEIEQAEGEIINRNALGFHVPGMYDRIVDIQHCYLQGDNSNDIRNAIRQYALDNELSFYDINSHQGFLRNLLIRTSTLGELMIIVSFGQDQPEAITALMEFCLANFPQLTSLHYVVNTKRNDSLYDQDIKTYHGRGYIYEQLDKWKYKISPKSFFQTNSYQAVNLYNTILLFANLQGTETVYDLYTGTGSIGIFISDHCKQVVGIEEVAAAIEDAKYNAQINKVPNASFYAGDVKELLTQTLVAKHGKPDVLITDPPRAGMHKDVVKMLLTIAPNRIVYVSCNPVTQARDLQLLSEKYTIEKLQAVDMFPHTYHIENVAALQLKEAKPPLN